MTTDPEYVLRRHGEFSVPEILDECYQLARLRAESIEYCNGRIVEVFCCDAMKKRLSRRFAEFFLDRFGGIMRDVPTDFAGTYDEFSDSRVCVRILGDNCFVSPRCDNTFGALCIPDLTIENGRTIPMTPRLHRVWIEHPLEYAI